jgi:anthranilate synthase component 2
VRQLLVESTFREVSLLLLDNYDSFTYNLCHLLEPYFAHIEVVRNDRLTPDDAEPFDHIVLSPGPGLPSEAGCMNEVIQRFWHQKPILGVCLGMQGIAESLKTPLINMPTVRHGRTTKVHQHIAHPIFDGVDQEFEVGLYHSWAVDHQELPMEMEPLAFSEEGYLMAMAHHSLPIVGLQFHPESVLTPDGGTIIRNWVNYSGQKRN